jgi:hypothetical protein
MKVNTSPRIASDPALMREMREHAQQINALAEGRMAASYNALTAAPTAGIYAVGDFIRNSAPAEAGAVASKYVVLGWVCTVAGTPGTWLQCRVLTGN